METTTAAELAGPVVLVVDAMDEAGTKETRQPLLDAIAEEFPNLPQTVKIIITSRDEQDILKVGLMDLPTTSRDKA